MQNSQKNWECTGVISLARVRKTLNECSKNLFSTFFFCILLVQLIYLKVKPNLVRYTGICEFRPSQFLMPLSKALYILGLPADVIQFSWLYLFLVELMVQMSTSLSAKNICSLTRFLQYLQTDLYQFFALSKCYIKEEFSLIMEWKTITS